MLYSEYSHSGVFMNSSHRLWGVEWCIGDEVNWLDMFHSHPVTGIAVMCPNPSTIIPGLSSSLLFTGLSSEMYDVYAGGYPQSILYAN